MANTVTGTAKARGSFSRRSHANSGKDHTKQPEVVEDIARQLESGSQAVIGVMLESFLEDGNQNHEKTPELTYGQSITDKCMGWQRTEPLFARLAAAP